MDRKELTVLIIKERQKPEYIQQLEALLRRLSPNHPKRESIETELGKHLAGHRGEESIEFYLSELPFENFFLLHNVRLAIHEDHFIQLDTIILTSHFIVILEVKNLTGKLMFDPTFHQLIREKDGVEEVFPDPILQINRQRRLFQQWLEFNKFPQLPIESFIVISNPSTLIRSTVPNHEISGRVFHSAFLPDKMEAIRKRYSKGHLPNKDVKKLANILKKKNRPLIKDVLAAFQLSKAEILTGVQCPGCLYLPMQRQNGQWICSSCSVSNKTAHLQGIHDYFLLFQKPLTNEELRSFLHISSRHVSRRLLLSAQLERKGQKKYRTYTIPTNRE